MSRGGRNSHFDQQRADIEVEVTESVTKSSELLIVGILQPQLPQSSGHLGEGIPPGEAVSPPQIPCGGRFSSSS